MSFVFTILFGVVMAFGQATPRNDPDLGPVDPEFAAIVKEVEKVSCEKSNGLNVRPFVECERLRRELRGAFATIKRYRDQHQAEQKKLTEALAGRADIDTGSQCAVAVINDRTYAFARTLEDRTIRNEKFARAVEEGLGAKPWKELREFREKAAKTACSGACERRGLPNCEGSCQFNRQAKAMFEVQIGFHAAELLPPGPGYELVRGAEAELSSLSLAAGKARKELEASLERFRQMAREAQGSARRIAGAYDCEKTKKELEEKVKGATAYMQMPEKEERGSGVFVRTGSGANEETHLLTARHVPGVRNESGRIERHVPTEVIPSREAEKEIRPVAVIPGATTERFEIEPGRVHAGEDLVSKPMPRVPDALGVVPAGTRPEVGQEFFVGGHPGTYDTEFVAHRCTFQGYGSGDWNTETHYYLDCPSSVGGQWGLSGGPMYDSSGRVWGVASQQPGFTRLIQIAPVSESQDGRLQLGLQEAFLSDYCRSPDAPGFRRCHVIPGSAGRPE